MGELERILGNTEFQSVKAKSLQNAAKVLRASTGDANAAAFLFSFPSGPFTFEDGEFVDALSQRVGGPANFNFLCAAAMDFRCPLCQRPLEGGHHQVCTKMASARFDEGDHLKRCESKKSSTAMMIARHDGVAAILHTAIKQIAGVISHRERTYDKHPCSSDGSRLAGARSGGGCGGGGGKSLGRSVATGDSVALRGGGARGNKYSRERKSGTVEVTLG